MSDEALLEIFRHNAWANSQIIDFCKSLTGEQLGASMPGVYGSVISTLQHSIGAEGYYRSFFSGALPPWARRDGDPASLQEMSLWAEDMAAYWQTLLTGPFDASAPVLQKRRDGSIYELQVGVMLAQVIHHSNVHREQICAVVTSLGLAAPDVSGWHFGEETGRIVLQRAQA